MGKARAAAKVGRAHLQRQLDDALKFPELQSAMVAADIRSHFASLSVDERMPAIVRAMEAGHAVTLKAISAGPDYLSGFSRDLHGTARDRLVAGDPATRELAQQATAFDDQVSHAELIER